MQKLILTILIVLLARPILPLARAAGPPRADPACTPLPPPTGTIVDVATTADLIAAVNNAASGATIRLADGVYTFGNGDYLRFATPNVTLRSAGGDRVAVILDGNYQATELVQIVAANITIADLTLREAYDHPIHVMTAGSDTLGTLIYNVQVIDPGQQAIKINPAGDGFSLIDGTIACSHIELTAAGRPHIRDNCYTGGIDAHQAQGWTIRDNVIAGFWCPSGLSEHGIHLWNNSSDTVVERNRLYDNARGIGFGLGSSGHSGGIIRNNMVQVNQDVGIGLESAPGARVYHNSVYTEGYPNAIEYRFGATSGVEIINNLTNQAITSRDGGSGTVQTNVTAAQAAWFVDPATADLHLASGDLSGVIDQGQTLAAVSDDFDGDSRPMGAGPDIGADEYGVAAPAAVTDLRVSEAISGGGSLTATLTWTAPADALTGTLRYSQAPITIANWTEASLLTDVLPGDAETYLAVVPFSGDPVYFAHRARNAGGQSDLSNNAVWPRQSVYLPVLTKGN